MLPIPSPATATLIQPSLLSFHWRICLISLHQPLTISCSFDRILENIIPSTSGVDQDRFLDRTLQFTSILYESTKQCFRKHARLASLHNSISWPLPADLTVKVFSMLDTKSLMQASACCSMFNKYSMDPVCYSHIDLTMDTKHVDDGVVCVMIHRAGKELRSLKLGFPTLLTTSCLAPLSINHGFAGGLLRSLHLYASEVMDNVSLCTALSTCSKLIDLKISIFDSGDMSSMQLEKFTRNCHLLEHLFIKHNNDFPEGSIFESSLVEFVGNCPNLSSLTLQDFAIDDAIARIIIKGFRQLKYIDLSHLPYISGSFLRDSPLESLLLRDCLSLKETELKLFLNSLLIGDFKCIRYIDVSSGYGLFCDDGETRTFKPEFPVEQLKKDRPRLTFVADYSSQPSSRFSIY